MPVHCTKNEVSIKDLFSKCDQIHRKLRIWSHLLEKSLMEKAFFVQWYLGKQLQTKERML